MSTTPSALPSALSLAAAAVAIAAASNARAAPERYALDPDHASLAFLVEHVGYAKVIGRFDDVRGGFTYDVDTGAVSALEIVVATASVDTNHEARDEHLRKADFLDVERHPRMVYTARALVPGAPMDGEDGRDGDATGDGAAGDGAPLPNGTLDGELELLGEVRPLALDVTLNKAAGYPFGHGKFTLGVSARGRLPRSAWGMDYGVADALVGDEVELLIEAEAIREAAGG